VPEKSLIDPGHFRRGHQVDADFHPIQVQFRQQRLNDLFQQRQVYFLRALAVDDDNVHVLKSWETT